MNAARLTVLCRPARPEDTWDVLELTKTIWEGHDYVPEVWDEWLADTEGRLIVAEFEGRVLGTSKLSRLSQQDWWMQGLRVHPDFEGRGIGSQLTEATVQSWLEIGCGTVGLGTASFRLPVHQMCKRLGFQKINERAPFYAPAIQEEDPITHFLPIEKKEIGEAAEFTSRSPSLALAAGLADLGWHYAPPRLEFLAAAAERGMAWWWQGREAVLTARLDDDDELGEVPSIEALACRVDALPQILLEFRCLVSSMGYSQAAWMAPLNVGVEASLVGAGYKRVWEDSLYIYTKNHPDSSTSGAAGKL